MTDCPFKVVWPLAMDPFQLLIAKFGSSVFVRYIFRLFTDVVCIGIAKNEFSFFNFEISNDG